MTVWKWTDASIYSRMVGEYSLANTTAGEFKVVLTYNGALVSTNATVADFLNSAGATTGEANNYTRPSLTSVAIDVSTPSQPKWTADNVNIEVSGGSLDANIVGIYAVSTGSDDSDTNMVVIANLGGTQSVTDGSNLVLDLSAGISIGDDPNFP